MWLMFLEDYDFVPPERRTVCIAYKRGTTQFVRRICATLAIGQGKAVKTERPCDIRR